MPQHSARLRFSLHSGIASAVHAALLPEALAQSADDADEGLDRALARSRTTARVEGDTVVLEFDADDLPALRAAVNSHVRLVDAAVRAAALAR
jgi:tRNA threonylcarbamoyladenosine modification (KEOPS) complex  Pcc1 subunit